MSETAVVCAAAPGAGGVAALARVAGSAATLLAAFSYDAPAVSFCAPVCLRFKPGAEQQHQDHLIFEYVFETSESGRMLFSCTPHCSRTRACCAPRSPPARTKPPHRITHTAQPTPPWSTRLPPAGASLTPDSMHSNTSGQKRNRQTTQANAPSSGGASITLLGQNLGVADASLTAAIGGTSCATVAWVGATAARCLSPVGAGADPSCSYVHSWGQDSLQ